VANFVLRHGAFSYLPPLTDEDIKKQVAYALENGWAVNIEFTNDPHPRNVYWEMWKLPFFDAKDGETILTELKACRKANPSAYIRVNAFDRSYGKQTTRLSFLVQRPEEERGFALERTIAPGFTQYYAVRIAEN